MLYSFHLGNKNIEKYSNLVKRVFSGLDFEGKLIHIIITKFGNNLMQKISAKARHWLRNVNG